jgi:hypothetical protein
MDVLLIIDTSSKISGVINGIINSVLNKRFVVLRYS